MSTQTALKGCGAYKEVNKKERIIKKWFLMQKISEKKNNLIKTLLEN